MGQRVKLGQRRHVLLLVCVGPRENGHGRLAIARVRPRTVYAITDKGRRALRRWLSEPGRAPLVEFEGAVKVLFAEHGTKKQLLETLASIREEAERTRDDHAALAAELALTGGPFPNRLHVNALVFKFMWEQAEMVIRWATWAEQEVERWPEDVSRPRGHAVPRALGEAADSSGA